jgi:hypothetical protein
MFFYHLRLLLVKQIFLSKALRATFFKLNFFPAMLNKNYHKDHDFDYNPNFRSKEIWVKRILVLFGLSIITLSFHYFIKIYEPFRERSKKLKYTNVVQTKKIEEPVIVKTYIKGRDWVVEGLNIAMDNVQKQKVVLDYYKYNKKNYKKRNLAIATESNEEPLFDEDDENTGQKKQQDSHKKKNISPLPKGLFYKKNFLVGGTGNFKLNINDKEFYIQGVTYNLAQDSRNGNEALTRVKLMGDLKDIKSMGANTITRVAGSNFDDIIFKVAEEEGLHVVLEFPLDPYTNYYLDSAQKVRYLQEIEATVRRHRYKKSLAGWTLGNKVWTGLKFTYQQPSIAIIRSEYIKFLNEAAALIHQLDGEHPVITTISYTEEFPSILKAIKKFAPEIDVIGISCFYSEQLETVQDIFLKLEIAKPYLIYEYGPRGYWNNKLSNFAQDVPVEESSFEKAAQYKDQWANSIKPFAGYNVGGIAYTWKDKLEGSATWYGITDYEGRKKPAFYYLREAWKGEKVNFPFPDIQIKTHKFPVDEEMTFEFAVDPGINLRRYKVEWVLYKFDYIQTTGKIQPLNYGQKVKVTIPPEPSLYRLHVYISDQRGNVITASKPILYKFGNKK